MLRLLTGTQRPAIEPGEEDATMDVYIFQAALWCEECGEAIRGRLTESGNAPGDAEDEGSYDSDDFPKGPFPDGGGEADTEQCCDGCGCELDNEVSR